jgi:hypothetical protein
MDGRNVTGAEEIARIHESGNGEPAIDSGGTRDMRTGCVGLKVMHEKIKLYTEESIE